MQTLSTPIRCDGCGLPVSEEHIAERLERLELATRYRPIHISVLFVALAPAPGMQDDFYRPPESKLFFESFLTALDVPDTAGKPQTEADAAAAGRLVEFQRRGYFLSYVSECPIDPGPSELRPSELREDPLPPAQEMDAFECIARLAPTLAKRIQLNYRPQHVALLGSDLYPLIEPLSQAGSGPLLLLDNGGPFELARNGDASSAARLRLAVAALSNRAASSPAV